MIIPLIIALVGLTVASYTDLKTREVPDWLNYSLVSAGLGLGLIYSLIFWQWSYILNSLAGFLIFLGFALLMFYAGQWGGGDSKMLMGLGALIGLDLSFSKFPFLVNFLFNLVVIGGIFGIIWSLALAFKRWRKFKKEFANVLGKKMFRVIRTCLLAGSLILILLFLFFIKRMEIFLLVFLLFVFLVYYLFAFVKAVEKACMFKFVKPKQLTEGDWIVKNVFIEGKKITGPKDLGISKKQIAKLRKLSPDRDILIKEGIPFVPSFLVAFIITWIFGNLMFLVV